jgi:DNA polymerase III sliding clamp (beta) subunit (PCNA family)
LSNIRNTAKNGKDLKSCDSETLYGTESEPELKYQVAEAAYANYERVLDENRETKKSLIAKRGALALALSNVRSVAETKKLSVALQVVNGKLATINEQEQQAFNKLVAIQVRNDQQEKLQAKAKFKQILMDFLNADPLQNASGSDE